MKHPYTKIPLNLIGPPVMLRASERPIDIEYQVISAYFLDVMVTILDIYREALWSKPPHRECLDLYGEINDALIEQAYSQQYDLYEYCIIDNASNYPGYVDFNDSVYRYFNKDEFMHLNFIEALYQSCHSVWFHPLLELLQTHDTRTTKVAMTSAITYPTHSQLTVMVIDHANFPPVHECHLSTDRSRTSYPLPF